MTAHLPALIRSLMNDHGMSERKLASTAKVNRSTVRRFLSSTSPEISIVCVDRMLAVFGYKLDAIAPEPKKEGKTCRLRLRRSVHAVV